MTWLDGTLLLVFVLFLAVGARLGSLWTAACLAGGFLGAFLADMYALSFAGYFKNLPGSAAIAGAGLFLAGAAVMILPGILLSGIFEGIFLGVIDSAFGLFTGAVAGLLAITALLLVVVPMVPRVESTRAWKRSFVVRPLQHSLESWFQSPRFSRSLSGLGAARGALNELEPVTERAGEMMKEAAHKAAAQLKTSPIPKGK